MKKTVNISLDEILQRKLEYYSNDSNQELLALNSGYVRGFKQMIADINLSEATFTDKYINTQWRDFIGTLSIDCSLIQKGSCLFLCF